MTARVRPKSFKGGLGKKSTLDLNFAILPVFGNFYRWTKYWTLKNGKYNGIW